MTEQGGAGAPDPWAGLPAEDVALVKDRHWDGVGALIRSYRHAEKRLGASPDKLLRIPDREDDAEGWSAIYGRLRPEKAEEYGIEGADPELLAKVHEAGLSKAQAKRLAEYLGERGKAAQEKSAQERGQKAEADIAALQREWGGEYDSNIAAGQRAKQALGWDDAMLDKLEEAIGTRATIELAARIGRGLREDGFAGPRGPQGATAQPFGLTREAAAGQLRSLEANPEWLKRRWSGDPRVSAEAMEERSRLSRIAHPDPD